VSWIDRINAAIVRRISGKATLLADEQGIEQAGQRLAWSGLDRAIAYRHPSLVGDDLAVALDFGESRIVVVSEMMKRGKRSSRPSTHTREADSVHPNGP
jgi:hypothetical protein